MKEIPIDSSNIKSLFYEISTNSLFCFFKSGAMYIYEGVTEEESNKLALQGGKYFYEVIKGKKEFTKRY